MTTRAYIRTDPGMFMRKAVEQRYPITAYATYGAVLCLAEEQPHRGRFRSERLLRLLLDDPTDTMHLGWGKHLRYLIEHGDIIRQPDGSLYVDGWDEWQEGDVTVNERMSRLRDRKRNAGKRNGVTPDVTPQVTVPVTPMVTVPVVTVPSDRSGSGSRSGGGSNTLGVLPRWGTSKGAGPDVDVHPGEAS